MRLDFKEERDLDLLSSYKSVIKEYGEDAPFLKKEFLLLQAINRPAKQFYVSEEQACLIVSKMLKGKSISITNSLKKMMYEEIFRRVKKEQESSSLPLPAIIRLVISQSAPRFYLTIESAQILYYKLIKKKHK